MDTPFLAIVLSFISALGFAGQNVLVRLGTQRVAAPTATFFTVLSSASLVLCLALGFRFQDILSLPPVAWAWFAVMGAIAYPLARVLINSSIIKIGAPRAASMSSFEPLFVLGLGMAFLGERPNLLVALGAPVVVLGLLLVFLSGERDRTGGTFLSTRNLGYLLALGSAAAFGSRDIISRHVVTSIAPPLVTTAFALTIGGLMLFIMTYRDAINSLKEIPSKYILICGVAGLLQGLAVVALFQAFSRAPVTVVSPIVASNPLFTLVLAHLFLSRLESINWKLVVGILLSVMGVAMVIVGA